MRHTLHVALMEHQAQLDTDINAAIDAYMQPHNIKRVIDQVVYSTIESILKQEVDTFFRYGEGRKFIAGQIKEKLLANETYTPLDNV